MMFKISIPAACSEYRLRTQDYDCDIFNHSSDLESFCFSLAKLKAKGNKREQKKKLLMQQRE